jgi:DUF1680 family protein
MKKSLAIIIGAGILLACLVFAQRSAVAGPPKTAQTVDAGCDRVVILGGKTYLSGKLPKSGDEKLPAAKVAWSKVSGPGEVAFGDAGAPVTTATFSKIGAYVLKLTARQSDTLAVKVISPPPEMRLDRVEIRKYKVDGPFWKNRIKAQIVNWIPHLIKKLNDPKLTEGGLNNFISAANKLAGKPHNKEIGHVASDAWVYNTFESICLALLVDPQGDREIVKAQKAMKATLVDWIPKILAAREPDGYLQTRFTLSGKARWSPKNQRDHEGYVAGYFIDACIAHYLMTGGKDDRMYNAARKLADCWDRNLGPSPKKQWYNGHQAMEMALVRLGRLVNRIEGESKGDKYVALAKFLLDSRKGGHEYDQSHVTATRQYRAVGHAVRASYSYAGMAGVAMETGDIDYHSATAAIWDNLIHRKYYINGGIGSGDTSEGFGPDYSLQQMSYCEACSSCGQMYFQHQMNMAYHDAKYADLCEETLYNAVLGSIDLRGKGFYYRNLLDSRWARYPWHGCPCCVGNIPRVLLMLPTWMYTKSSGGVYVNLFIPSTVTLEDIAGARVEILQVTDYPWKGEVSITVNPVTPKKFTVRVRIPRRDVSDIYSAIPNADGVISFKLNGSPIKPPVEKGYAVITRTWTAGDKIELTLPMKIQRIKAIDAVASTRGKVALRYGPLLYNVERLDQDITKVLKPDAPLTTEWRGDFLDGVMVINGAWSDGSKLLAIPYYARENRSLENSRKRTGIRSISWLNDRRPPDSKSKK